MNRRLYRSVADRRIGGVAAGTATYFDIDPSISRVVWVLLAFLTGGAFVIVYLVMWAIVPEEPYIVPPVAPAAAPAEGGQSGEGAEAAPATGEPAATTETTAGGGAPAIPPAWPPQETRPSSGPGGHVILGSILILIGGWFLVREFLPGLDFDVLWPIGLVVVGVLILLAAVRRGS